MSRHNALTVLALCLAVGASAASCGRSPSAEGLPSPSATTTLAPQTTPASQTTHPSSAAPTPTRTTAPTATTPSGPPTFPASLRGQDLEVLPTTARVIALTFDAGANAAGLPSILSTLDRGGVTATFFLTGGFANQYPTSVQAIVAGGHRLGNHTATHPHLPFAVGGGDGERTDAGRVADPRGRRDRSWPLFRFPFGDRNAHTIAVVNGAGYVAVRWTVDTLGWKGTTLGGITAQIVVDRVVATARPGQIVLMHVGSNPDDHTTLDADALPTVISRLRDLGYGFVTLDALLAAA